MAYNKPIGIDLGTTFSAVAVLEAGKPVIIPNSEGDRTTPSVVLIRGKEIVVGKVAKNQAIVDPAHVVRSIKRKMGTREKITIDNKEYSPEQISAMILQKLKSDAEAYLGTEVKDVVITVPAYFTDAQRQATKDAGKIAGLNVLRIINEPTAAALAYGLDKTQNHNILVFDFGGGTFDVSILEINDGVFEVKATSGNNYLGGDDIDQILIDYIADDFKAKYGIDLREDKISLQRLKEAAEKAKIELSSAQQTEINIPFITATNAGPLHLQLTLTRSKFEQLIQPILNKLKEPTLQALKDANMTKDDIDKVILVGGSTRIPAVQNLVKELIGKNPEKSVNPDEAVALGAAIQAGVLKGEVKDVLLLDVTPLSLGIETLGGVFTKIIERNTTIPTKKSQIFTTAADNQTAVTIKVYQGERAMATDNKLLGEFDLIGIPPAPRGVPKIEVTFDIDSNGIVHVSAKDLATGKEQAITVTGASTLTEEEIKKMQKEAEMYAEEDKKKKERIETLNNAENLIYSTEKILNDFKDKVDESKLKPIKDKIAELKKILDKKEKTDDDVNLIKTKMEELNKEIQKVSIEMYNNVKTQEQAQQANQTKATQDKKSEDGNSKVYDTDAKEKNDDKK